MTPQRSFFAVPAVVAVALLTGCVNLPYNDPAGTLTQIPNHGALVPNANVQLTPSVGIALEKLVFWGMYAGAAYLILDPLAPNWEIEQAAFPDAHYHLSLKMKRYYAGGAGEARTVFHARARDLMRVGGYTGYTVLQYSEGMESSVLGSQRVGEGVIQLTRKN